MTQGFDLVKSSVPFKMTGSGGKDFKTMMGDAPTAMNGIIVVSSGWKLSVWSE